MNRRILLGATLVAALAAPTAASAHSRPTAVRGHHSKVHVIAVRRGHRLVWLNKRIQRLDRRLSHEQISRRGHARRFEFRRLPTTSESLTVNFTGQTNCIGRGSYNTLNYTLNYGAGLGSQTLLCNSYTGATSDSHTEGTGCNIAYPSTGPYGYEASYDVGTFADGLEYLVCNTPDENSANQSNANAVPFSFYSQGFRCQDTVGTGADGNTPLNIKNSDSIEVYQPYTDYNGDNVTSITTACFGTLPAGVTAPSTSVTHEVGCSEYNPYTTGYVRSLGETVTYPDGEYAESCNLPNFPTPSS
jgi:hypothetical protein